MKKNVFAAVIGSDEPKPFLANDLLNRPRHNEVPFLNPFSCPKRFSVLDSIPSLTILSPVPRLDASENIHPRAT
jgi:hypothetical protein